MTNSWFVRLSVWERPLLVIALCVSVGASVAMAYAYKNSRPAADPGLAIGQAAPALELVGSRGTRETIRFSDALEGTVLYVVSPSCPWCEKNRDNAAALAAHVKGRYRFLGVGPAVAGLDEYREAKGIDFELFAFPEATRAAYQLKALPQTIVIDPDGIVKANWVGAYNAAIGSKVEAMFGLRLPGLRDK